MKNGMRIRFAVVITIVAIMGTTSVYAKEKVPQTTKQVTTTSPKQTKPPTTTPKPTKISTATSNPTQSPTTPPRSEVKPGKAQILKLVHSGSNIRVYWTKAKNITSYNVLRSNEKNGNYSVIAKNIKGTYFRDNGIVVGTTYYYKIQSVNKNTSNTAYSKVKKCKTLKTPKISLKNQRGVYYLSWKAATTPDGYVIYTSSTSKGKYSEAGRVATNQYNSYKLISQGKKYYQIKPFYVVNGKTKYGQKYSQKKINITKVQLPVRYICQYPKLPTGCETTALTMALNYHGFAVSKETIASSYLPKTERPGDFYNYFVGNPFSSTGLGIYAPGLTRAANNYLTTQNTSLRAYNVTGIGMSKICQYVATGHPVCIWTTLHLNKNPKVTSTWTINGKTYDWKSNEHCMTVIGFNKKKKTLIIANPAEGIREYSRKLINKRNKQYNRMAVIIQ